MGGGPGTLSRRSSYMLPSLAIQADMSKSPTAYGPPIGTPPLPSIVPPPSISINTQMHMHSQTDSTSTIGSLAGSGDPRTPAYPAFPTSPPPVPSTPFWQAPIAQQTGAGAVGPSVEISRDRAAGSNVPPTPGPRLGGFGAVDMSSALQSSGLGSNGVKSEPVVVSVSLLSSPPPSSSSSRKPSAEASGVVRPVGKIYPLDQFTLDIFVFNQSSWTRRFEVSYPEERRRRRRAPPGTDGEASSSAGKPGILPLENRVRVG